MILKHFVIGKELVHVHRCPEFLSCNFIQVPNLCHRLKPINEFALQVYYKLAIFAAGTATVALKNL